MNILKTAVIVTALVVASSSLAMAQGAGKGTGEGPVGSACKAEIAKLCAGKPHGGGEVRACLEAKKAELSPACKTALDTTGPGKGMGRGKAN